MCGRTASWGGLAGEAVSGDGGVVPKAVETRDPGRRRVVSGHALSSGDRDR